MNLSGNAERVLSLLSIGFLFLLAIALLVTWSTPAKGYEPSIYISTPVIYWIALSCCYVFCGFVLCLSIRKYVLSFKLKITGIIIMLLATISLISLFILRGQLIYCIYGDTGVHIGNLLNIISSGYVSSVYPGSYIESVILFLSTNLELYPLLNYHVVIYGCVFVIGVYLSTREITGNKYIALITAFIACLFPFGSAYYSTGGWTFSMYIPCMLTFQLFPILIYAVIKIMNQSNYYNRFFVITTLLCVTLSIFHLFAALISLMFIACLLIVHFIFQRSDIIRIIFQVGLALLTSGIFYVFWLSTTFYFKSQISSFVKLIFESEETSYNKDILSEMGDSIFSNFQIFEIADFIFRSYGLLILFCLITLVSIPLIIKSKKSSQKLAPYITFYLFIGGCGVLVIYSLFGTASYQTGRVIPFIVLGCIFIAGYMVYRLITVVGKHKLHTMASIITGVTLIVCIGLLSVSSYYHAPHTLTTSNQETSAVLCDMEFQFEKVNYYHNITGLYYYPSVYAMALYGNTYIRTNLSDVYLLFGLKNYPGPPDHFNYFLTDSLGEYYMNPTYVMINQKFIDDISARYIRNNNTLKFISKDFMHLENDIYVDKIHDNSVDVYTIF